MAIFRGFGPGTRYREYVKPVSYGYQPYQTRVEVTPRVLMEEMSDPHLVRLRDELNEEILRRRRPAFEGVANFLAGVTQAMTARSFLRWSKGLRPHYKPDGKLAGKTPTSGEMWHANEGAVGERLMAKGMAQGSLHVAPFNPLVQEAGETIKYLQQEGWLP